MRPADLVDGERGECEMAGLLNLVIPIASLTGKALSVLLIMKLWPLTQASLLVCLSLTKLGKSKLQ